MAFDLNNAPLLIGGSMPAAVPLDTPVQNAEGMQKIQAIKQQQADEVRVQQAQDAFRSQLQQNGGDYDSALTSLDKQGYNTLPLRNSVADYRKKLADNAKSQLDALKTENEIMSSTMSGVKDQASWDAVRPLVARIDPQFVQQAGPTYDQARFDQYKNIGVSVKDQHDYAQKSLENLANGEGQKAVAHALASTTDDADLAAAVKTLRSYGNGDVNAALDAQVPAGTRWSPALVAQAQQASLSAKEQADVENSKAIRAQTAATEKATDAYRTAELARQTAANAETARHNKVSEQGDELTPEDVKASTKTTMAGRQYLNMGDFQGVKEKHAARIAAEQAGLPIVDEKTAMGLQALDRAKFNAHTMWEQIKDKLPKDAQGRLIVGPENKLSAYFQTDPVLGAQGTWRTAAIQQVQALAEPGMGLRINQAEIDAAMDNDIPKGTDTIGTAAQRIQNLMSMLDGKEQVALTPDRSQLLAPGGAKAPPKSAAPKGGPTGLFMKNGKLVDANGNPY